MPSRGEGAGTALPAVSGEESEDGGQVVESVLEAGGPHAVGGKVRGEGVARDAEELRGLGEGEAVATMVETWPHQAARSGDWQIYHSGRANQWIGENVAAKATWVDRGEGFPPERPDDGTTESTESTESRLGGIKG